MPLVIFKMASGNITRAGYISCFRRPYLTNMFNLFHRCFFFAFLRFFRIILNFQSFLPAFQLVIEKAPQNCSISLVTSKVSRNTGNVQCARHQTLSHSVTRTPNYWTMNISNVFKADGIFKQRTRAFLIDSFQRKLLTDWTI